jgi:hypothetical protein
MAKNNPAAVNWLIIKSFKKQNEVLFAMQKIFIFAQRLHNC